MIDFLSLAKTVWLFNLSLIGVIAIVLIVLFGVMAVREMLKAHRESMNDKF